MQIVILKNSDAVADFAAQKFLALIQNKKNAVLGLATGSTPIPLYKRLIQLYRDKKISFTEVTSFNLDEYLGLPPEHPQSYRYFMNTHLFNHVDINPSRVFVPSAEPKDADKVCKRYETLIDFYGGIDLQLLGIGRNGHIGFNEPSSGLYSRTRIKTLTQETITDNARFFQKEEFQPHLSITMGIGTILESREALLLAVGESKSEAIRNAVEGPVSASCPASALQLHPKAVIVIDEAAASQLQHKEFYVHVEKENNALQATLSDSGQGYKSL